MIRRRDFRRDESGASAVELALVMPIVVGLLLYGVNAWLQLSHAQDMSSALNAGARYYQEGGADDDAARSLALAAWPNTPADASLSISRSCTCGTTATACSTVCSGAEPPRTYVALSAQSTFRGLRGPSLQKQTETIRVR